MFLFSSVENIGIPQKKKKKSCKERGYYVLLRYTNSKHIYRTSSPEETTYTKVLAYINLSASTLQVEKNNLKNKLVYSE